MYKIEVLQWIGPNYHGVLEPFSELNHGPSIKKLVMTNRSILGIISTPDDKGTTILKPRVVHVYGVVESPPPTLVVELGVDTIIPRVGH